MTDALLFLRTRRSRPQKILKAPFPDRDTIEAFIEIACRTPDHGKLEPWRFIVFDGPALLDLVPVVRALAAASDEDLDDGKITHQFATSGCAVMVVESPKPGAIPPIEQTYSAGAVCLSLLNAGLAAGWGANWLSGWASHQRGFCDHLGLTAHERIAGIVHFGTGPGTMPDRPRPDPKSLTTWNTQ